LTIEDQGPAASPVFDRPSAIFDRRVNPKGWNIPDPLTVAAIEVGCGPFATPFQWGENGTTILYPANIGDIVSHVALATPETAGAAVDRAVEAAPEWPDSAVTERIQIINRVADLYECVAYGFFALAARETGKIVADCVAKVRKAPYLLRLYAVHAALAQAMQAAGTWQ